MKALHGARAWCAVLLSTAVALVGCAGFAQDQPAATAGAPATAPAAPTVAQPPKGALTVYFLDVDQGDSTVITTPAGKTILIDGSRGGSGYKKKDKGKTVIIPFLKEKGIKKLDMVIMTHADEDHIGGLITVVGQTKPGSDYPVAITEFMDPGQHHTTFLYQELLKAVKDRPEIKYRNPRSGEMLDFGEGVTAQVMNPKEVTGNPNAASIVVKVTRGPVSFLLTGDAETEAEKIMLEEYGDALKSTVLKAGHHGSGASSTEAFLKAVKPEAIVISVGTKNKFILPDKLALGRMEATGAKIYRTDYQGAITVTANGKGYSVVTERKAPPVNERWDTVPTLSEDQRVDINNAPQAELEKLPRIGKGIAEGIIKRRPYTSVDELRRVPGIGVKILDRLRPLITVRPPVEGTPGVHATPGAGAAPGTEASPEATQSGEGKKVNVNTAPPEELEKVPGVGPSTAKAIIAGRPYGNVGELRSVLGVGPAKLGKMLPYITIEPPGEKPGKQSLLRAHSLDLAA
jgi:competence ComEA-like helix-hairpin-helix protein